MTFLDRTSGSDKHNVILLRWVSAGTTLVALGATCALALSGLPEVAVATAALGTVGSLSLAITVVIVHQRR